MRIAFIHPRFPSAEGTGATHSATQIVDGLANAGHDICVYCPDSPESRSDRSNIQLRHLTGNSSHPHTNTRLNKEVSSRLAELRGFDIVHSYLTPLIPSIAQIGESSSVKTFVTLNAYGGTCAKNDLLYRDQKQCQSKSTLKCMNCISRTGFDSESGYLYETASELLNLRLINSGERRLEHIDGFRAPSAHVRDNYVQFGYDADKIAVIPHPVDEDFIIPHESNFSEPYKLLYVGGLEKHKGADKLIPILSSLAHTDVKFTLTVVGTGSLEEKIRKQAQAENVANLINFRGFVPNKALPKVYASHDCFVYPGIWEEPLARVYLESLAAGTPIVTSEYGTIGEIVGDAGQLTDGSVDGFRDAILEIADSETLNAKSEAANEQVTNFDRSQVIEDIEKLYTDVVDFS
ncbi:glycosyltransferase family 4 protein [Halorubrum ezzemoulense]|uniref:glycosyltransferase family 4 protein n=1 Tax=Halorubrum TaxID=56688 RepID=UPI0010F91C3B|nr:MULTISPECIES: glycosyltransferase family 4 protein [Halorubrum]MDB2253511.1 glycosyltransferase family 4 protein [Halorubrum ezzemoulense]TKX63966.1 glycosyltransferase family 1 protein [Halorubrum sp. GN12_10-3_MGM]